MRRKDTRIHRKKTAAYVETEPEDIEPNTTGICDTCYYSGVEVLLIPYKSPEYGFDKQYMQCPECHKIIPKGFVKHKAVEGALGNLDGISPSRFEVIKRKRRFEHDTRNVFHVEDHPLTPDGKEDGDLRFFANQGIIVSITDQGEEEE